MEKQKLFPKLISGYVKEKAWSLIYVIAWCLGVVAKGIAILLWSYFTLDIKLFGLSISLNKIVLKTAMASKTVVLQYVCVVTEGFSQGLYFQFLHLKAALSITLPPHFLSCILWWVHLFSITYRKVNYILIKIVHFWRLPSWRPLVTTLCDFKLVSFSYEQTYVTWSPYKCHLSVSHLWSMGRIPKAASIRYCP